jgi:hypothetical protein
MKPHSSDHGRSRTARSQTSANFVDPPDCGIKAEKVALLPSKVLPSASALRKRWDKPVKAQRYDEWPGSLAWPRARCERSTCGIYSAGPRGEVDRRCGRWEFDEIYLGKKQTFLTVVTNLETGEPLWFGRERKKETLDEFFEKHLGAFQRSAIRAARVDMWERFRQSLEQWVPECRIIYDKFHILQHASQAVDEVRRAEFFRKEVRRGTWCGASAGCC